MDIYLKGLEEPLELFDEMDRISNNVIIMGENGHGKSFQVKNILSQIKDKKFIVITNHLEDFASFKDIILYSNRNEILDIGDYSDSVIVFECPDCPTDKQMEYINKLNKSTRMENAILITTWKTDADDYYDIVNASFKSNAKYIIKLNKENHSSGCKYLIKQNDDTRWNIANAKTSKVNRRY